MAAQSHGWLSIAMRDSLAVVGAIGEAMDRSGQDAEMREEVTLSHIRSAQKKLGELQEQLARVAVHLEMEKREKAIKNG